MRIPRLEVGGLLLILSMMVIGIVGADSALRCVMPASDRHSKWNEKEVGSVRRVSWSGDGMRLLSRSRCGLDGLSWLTVNNVISGGLDDGPFFENQYATVDAVLSPDGQHALVCNDRGELFFCDLQSYELTELVFGSSQKPMNTAVAISSGGSLIAVATDEGEIHLSDSTEATGVILETQRTATIADLRFSNDDRQLLVVRYDGSIQVWSTQAGTLLSERKRRAFGQTAAAFLAEASRVLSFSGAENLEVWDVDRGTLLCQMPSEVAEGYILPVLDASSDGRTVAWGCAARRIIVWDFKSSRKRCEIVSPSAINDIAFSPDGSCLAVAGDEDCVRIYDSATGRQINKVDARPRGTMTERI